ncbi:MAG: type 2 isopentenyl-diphosphate Delta-isomerase [Rhizobiaceae bacterium]
MSDRSANERKLDHIRLALLQKDDPPVAAGWDKVRLRPVALPQTDVDDIQLETEFLGFQLNAPIMIAGMTGGHPGTEKVNRNLAIAAAECGVAIGLGSQRVALADPGLCQTFAVARDHAPKAFLCGNIGISQIANRLIGAREIKSLIDMIAANAMAVHVNVLQEIIQPEGSIDLKNALPALADFVERCPVPVIVKETGCGIDQATARRLSAMGVSALDVGGAGGTSFVTIEGARAEEMGEVGKSRLADTFSQWGLSTVEAVRQLGNFDLPVVATGGIRNGLHAAKAIGLGADLAGIGSQMLKAAVAGPDETTRELRTIIEELKIAMVLTECRIPFELRKKLFAA